MKYRLITSENLERNDFYYHDYKIKQISRTNDDLILELGDISKDFIESINKTIKNEEEHIKEKYTISFKNIIHKNISYIINKINSSLFQIIDTSLKNKDNKILVYFKLFDINSSLFEELSFLCESIEIY